MNCITMCNSGNVLENLPTRNQGIVERVLPSGGLRFRAFALAGLDRGTVVLVVVTVSDIIGTIQ
jgi:hypothetical protein